MKKIFVAVIFYIIDKYLYMVNFIQKITEKFFFHAIKFQYMDLVYYLNEKKTGKCFLAEC